MKYISFCVAFVLIILGMNSCSSTDNEVSEKQSSGWTLPESTTLSSEPVTSVEKVRFGSLASGPSYTCGISNEGTAICWGRDDHGEASPPEGTFSFLSVALKHACGVSGEGQVRCWGADTANETQAPEGQFTHVSTARLHTCGVRDDATIACWGHGSIAEEDEGSIPPVDDADQAVPPSGSFSQVAATDDFTCGLRTDGAVQCWGEHVEYLSEDKLQGPFVQIDAGPTKVCGVRQEDKGISCWPLGWGEAEAPDAEYLQVSVGDYHTCALDTDYNVICWGSGSEPEVQQEGPYDFDQALPPEGNFLEVSAGKFHTCALAEDGTVSCWGRDHNGETNPPESFSTGTPSEDETLCQRACRNAVERCLSEEERAEADVAGCEQQCEEVASDEQRECVLNATTCEDAHECTL